VTVRSLPRSRLQNLVPTLFGGQALVALVPATADARWAAEAAWEVARAAASAGEGRRVALVDLFVEEPMLHQIVGQNPDDGIVDAFEYGVSLSKVARELNGVFFIPAGTYTARPADVFTQPRWAKLQAGFRAEDALLLLYMSSTGLARLAAVPDGIVVFAPGGFDEHFSPVAQGVQRAVERGATFLGVVRERWTPPPSEAPVVYESEPTPALPPRPAVERRPVTAPVAPRRWLSVAAATLAVGLVFAVPSSMDPRSQAATPGPVAVTEPGAGSREPQGDTAQSALGSRLPAPTFAVQVAAFNQRERAEQLARELAAAGEPTAVRPTTPRAGGVVWYRVVVGPFPTEDDAARARRRLWESGQVRRGEGMIVQGPS
jgi:cell division septation protein DedD